MTNSATDESNRMVRTQVALRYLHVAHDAMLLAGLIRDTGKGFAPTSSFLERLTSETDSVRELNPTQTQTQVVLAGLENTLRSYSSIQRAVPPGEYTLLAIHATNILRQHGNNPVSDLFQ